MQDLHRAPRYIHSPSLPKEQIDKTDDVSQGKHACLGDKGQHKDEKRPENSGKKKRARR